MREVRCCDLWNFPRTLWSSSWLSWPTLAMARCGLVHFIDEGKTGCFLWVIQQSMVVGCFPGVQALTVRGCFVVTPVDMFAVEVANIETGVCERRDGRWCESRTWRFVDVHDIISCNVYAEPLSLGLLWRLIEQ